jgi:hypothetical protein
MELSEILAGLRSEDVLLQVSALTAASELVRQLTGEAIDLFLRTDFRHPIAETLLKFGGVMKPPLEDVLTRPVDDDAKATAAALLFELGSMAGIPYLKSLLDAGKVPRGLAALYLGKAHVSDAAGSVERALRQWDVRSDPYGAGTLIDALMTLGSIPSDLRQHLLEEWPEQMKPALLKLLES